MLLAVNGHFELASFVSVHISLTPETFKRQNSKQRRSSTRLSEKSSPDRSISSSLEEAITSNSDLVGVDGLGKELILKSVHDDEAKTFEQTDDEDDDNDKKQLNAFDAWGYRREPVEMNDLSIEEEEEEEIENKRYSFSNPKKSSNQTSNMQSGSESSETDDDDSSSTGNSSINKSNDVSEFQQEVVRTLERTYTQKVKIENIIVELNILKPTYDVSPTKQAQMTLINELGLICLKHIQPIGERIVNILDYLCNKDAIDEQWVLKWHKNNQEKIDKNEVIIKPEEKIYYKLKEFVEWLQNAESDDDDDDDD